MEGSEASKGIIKEWCGPGSIDPLNGSVGVFIFLIQLVKS